MRQVCTKDFRMLLFYNIKQYIGYMGGTELEQCLIFEPYSITSYSNRIVNNQQHERQM